MIRRVLYQLGIIGFALYSVLASAADHTKAIYVDKKTGRVVQTVLVVPFEYDLDYIRIAPKVPSLTIEAEATDLLRRRHYDVTSLDFGSYSRGPYTSIEGAIKSRGRFDSYLKRGSEFDVIFSMLFQLEAAPAFDLLPLVSNSENLKLTAQALMFRIENEKKLKRVWSKTSDPVEAKIGIQSSLGDGSGLHYERDVERVVSSAVITATSDVLNSLPDAPTR